MYVYVARRITFSLPDDLFRAVKLYVAEHETTVNSFARELLREKLESERKFPAAAERLLDLADKGPYFTGDPGGIRREELHERA
jgi:plasmid stability protein